MRVTYETRAITSYIPAAGTILLQFRLFRPGIKPATLSIGKAQGTKKAAPPAAGSLDGSFWQKHGSYGEVHMKKALMQQMTERA
jgi:hypothetical protein